MDLVDTNRPTSAKQEIEMRQEIVPFIARTVMEQFNYAAKQEVIQRLLRL